MNSEEVSGIILIDKPAKMTSHDVVFAMRRLFNTKKTGHTGTLDPDATGLLVVLVGRAAKAAEYITADDKVYETVMTLGVTTDTQDAGGNILSQSENIPDENTVMQAVSSFVGDYDQVPPMYSAIKQNGRKLVDLARKGVSVERRARPVNIRKIDCEKINEREYKMTVTCSKGTYIRTLCDDIGKKLGCGACMSSLRRIKSGGYDISGAVTLGECKNMTAEELSSRLLDVETLFSDLPVVFPEGFFLHLCKSGAELYQKKIKTSFDVGQRVRLYDELGFFALGEVREFDEGTAIKPIKVFRL